MTFEGGSFMISVGFVEKLIKWRLINFSRWIYNYRENKNEIFRDSSISFSVSVRVCRGIEARIGAAPR